MTNLATLAMYDGDYEAAVARYEEASAIARELGDERQLSLALQNVGIAHEGAGHRDRAIEALEESLALARRVADPSHLVSVQRSLARFLLDDDPARALAFLHESLELAREFADRNAIVELLETASAVAAGRGDASTGRCCGGRPVRCALPVARSGNPTRRPGPHAPRRRCERRWGRTSSSPAWSKARPCPSTKRSIALGRSAVTRT